MIKPKHLEPGDTVAVIAPSSPFEWPAFEKGVEALRSLGLQVTHPSLTAEKNAAAKLAAIPFLSASDDERLEALHAAFSDKQVKGIFCARGGYGSMRLLTRLKPEVLTQNPKIFVGYSDLTALLNCLVSNYSLVCFHGPVVAKDLDQSKFPKTLQSLASTLMRVEPSWQINPRDFQDKEVAVLNPGEARGILVGGNLSMICATLGTDFEIQTDRKILFLEEIGERPYRVDRLLQQLMIAKKLQKVSGIVFGDFVDCQEPKKGPDPLDIVRQVVKDLKMPIVYGFPAGHCAEKVTLPLGLNVELDANQGVLKFLESGVS